MTFKELSHVTGTAYDISDASLAFANQLISRNGYAQNLKQKDRYFDGKILPKFDFVIVMKLNICWTQDFTLSR